MPEAKHRGFPQLALRASKQLEKHNRPGNQEQSEMHAVPGSAKQSELHAVPGSPKRKLRECGWPHVQHLRFPRWRVYGALSGTELWKLAPRAEGMRLRKRKNAASLSSRFGLRSKGISVRTKANHHNSRFGLRSKGISVHTKANHHNSRFGLRSKGISVHTKANHHNSRFLLRSMGGFTGRRECPRSKYVPAVLGLSPARCPCRSA